MSDANIVAMAGEGDRLEVAVAKLAEGKATNPAVKAYARQLIDDHTKGDREVRALEQRLKLTEQPPADDTTKAELQHLTERFTALPKGMAFDTAFVHHEIEDHQNDIKDAKEMEGRASHPELKRLLQQELPELQRHLDRAQSLSKSLASSK